MGHAAGLNSRDAIGRSVNLIISLCQTVQKLTSTSVGLTLLSNILLIEKGQLGAILLNAKMGKKTRKTRIDQLRLGDFPLLQIPPKPLVHGNIIVFVGLNIRYALLLQKMSQGDVFCRIKIQQCMVKVEK